MKKLYLRTECLNENLDVPDCCQNEEEYFDMFTKCYLEKSMHQCGRLRWSITQGKGCFEAVNNVHEL